MASVPTNMYPLILRYWYDGDYHTRPYREIHTNKDDRDMQDASCTRDTSCTQNSDFITPSIRIDRNITKYL